MRALKDPMAVQDQVIDLLEQSMKKILVDLLSTRENNGHQSKKKLREPANN